MSSQKHLHHAFDESQEYYFKEGCFILEHLNTADDPQVSIARARVLQGQRTRWHKLNGLVERYLIMQGTGRVGVGKSEVLVGEGDVVVIPEGVAQRIENLGEQDLVFLAICSPRFTPECYEALGP